MLIAAATGCTSLLVYGNSVYWGAFFLMFSVMLILTYSSAVILNHLVYYQTQRRHFLLKLSSPAAVGAAYLIALVLPLTRLSLIYRITILSVIISYSLWVFFMETIKTHLINNLSGPARNI